MNSFDCEQLRIDMHKTTKYSAGFSLIEVLIAALLFSIIILGLTGYQQALIAKHHTFYTHLQAERIAFQLLDSYPNMAHHIIPNHWQYQINRNSYGTQCTMVDVILTLPNRVRIQQKRLFC